eukprot:TRINITY_DN48245_c0_g1_i1.p1 TRINITY_DN48245_c0_g1~~TRINITY_DN48245_c0_g1_i1.p1  ORF type:complete len:184 (+),score=46.53 TRINITY_DN48245_c0_g1_i1:45-554(+)
MSGEEAPTMMPRYGGALEWVKALQGRWHSGSGLVHRVEGLQVTCERTGSTTILEMPTKNIVMLMGSAIKLSSTHQCIDWTDGDVWHKMEEPPSPTHSSQRGSAPRTARHTPGKSPYSPQGNHTHHSSQHTPGGTFTGLTSLDSDRYATRQMCRDWEYQYSPLRKTNPYA